MTTTSNQEPAATRRDDDCQASRNPAVTDPDYVLYAIRTEDAQLVATEQLGRELTAEEISLGQDKLSFVDWYHELDVTIASYIGVRTADSEAQS